MRTPQKPVRSHGRQRLVSLAAPRARAQLAEQQPFSRCRPDGARQSDQSDRPVRPILGRWHGPRRSTQCVECAPCEVQATRLQLLDRHGAGQTVLHLHHGQRVVDKVRTPAAPQPSGRSRRTCVQRVAAAGRSSTRRSTVSRASFASLAPQTRPTSASAETAVRARSARGCCRSRSSAQLASTTTSRLARHSAGARTALVGATA